MIEPINVPVPDGESGNWRVETFTISQEDAALANIRAIRDRWARVEPGTYKRLMRGNTVVMSNTRMEVLTNAAIIRAAHGRVLLNGLGLGMVLTAILAKERVEAVRVIEKSEDVLRLVAPSFAHDPRVEIIHADALTYKSAPGERFNAVWHDIFDNICADNLPTMHTLHRKYGRRCDWQESWARWLCERRCGRS